MQRKNLLFKLTILALLIFTVAVIGWMSTSNRLLPPNSSAATVQSSTSSASSTSLSSPQLTGGLLAVLPALKSAAVTGDRVAACKLGFELSRCAAHLADKQKLEIVSKMGSSVGPLNPSQLAVKTATEDRVSRDASWCSGISNAETSLSWQFDLLAGQRGQPESAMRFAIGVGVPGLASATADPAVLEAYRTNAPLMMRSALDAGYLPAFRFAAGMSVKPLWADVRLLPHDPIAAAAYAYAAADSALGPARSEMEGNIPYYVEKFKLSPADLERARVMSIEIKKQITLPPTGLSEVIPRMYPTESSDYCIVPTSSK